MFLESNCEAPFHLGRSKNEHKRKYKMEGKKGRVWYVGCGAHATRCHIANPEWLYQHTMRALCACVRARLCVCECVFHPAKRREKKKFMNKWSASGGSWCFHTFSTYVWDVRILLMLAKCTIVHSTAADFVSKLRRAKRDRERKLESAYHRMIFAYWETRKNDRQGMRCESFQTLNYGHHRHT